MAASNGFFTSSPTVVLPPQPLDQYFANGHHYADSTMADQIPNNSVDPFAPAESIPPTPGSLAGRKRSRGDVLAMEEEEEVLGDGSVETPLTDAPAKPRGKPVYGPGMTLIYPEDPGYTAAAESQSGTWIEEREERKSFHLSHMKRPSISSRKSQRLETPGGESDDLAQLVLPPRMREVTAEPLIDEATRMLGISWTRMDSTEALRISQAAYSKWIQNHYPSLTEVSVWFENSAIPGYLVEALNGYSGEREYYIFSHDLQEARLVTGDPEQLVLRLQMLPALELAAPGGCIRAESDTTQAKQKEASLSRFSMGQDDFSMHAGLLGGYFCSAHEMDMD